MAHWSKIIWSHLFYSKRSAFCLLASEGKLLWDNPSKVGTYDPSCDCYRGVSRGWRNFVKHFDLRRRNYLKNDDLIIFIDFEGKRFDFFIWVRIHTNYKYYLICRQIFRLWLKRKFPLGQWSEALQDFISLSVSQCLVSEGETCFFVRWQLHFPLQINQIHQLLHRGKDWREKLVWRCHNVLESEG